jgi:hypothetical protein
VKTHPVHGRSGHVRGLGSRAKGGCAVRPRPPPATPALSVFPLGAAVGVNPTAAELALSADTC